MLHNIMPYSSYVHTVSNKSSMIENFYNSLYIYENVYREKFSCACVLIIYYSRNATVKLDGKIFVFY